MKVKEIIELFEKLAPSVYQESYDNAGLITGNKEMEVEGILLCLDTTEAVLDEAIQKGCNMIIAHHPIIFKGLKRLNGSNYVERTIIKAIKNDIAILAWHTNLDNVLKNGVNQKFAQKLELKNLKILAPKKEVLSKIYIYVPESHHLVLRDALFSAGAGHIGEYSECSFSTQGTGTFKPGTNSRPFIGTNGQREEIKELKIEVLLPSFMANKLIEAAKTAHPYEEMAYEIIQVQNFNQEIGSGIIGELEDEMPLNAFLEFVKKKLNLSVIRHTKGPANIKKVALCGGSGSFLTQAALHSGADAYVTADIKYHEFFDAEEQMLLCDIGHYESEISTLEIFYEIIKEKYPNFAVIFCGISTNPIQYFK